MTNDVTARLAAIDDWLDDQDWSTQPSDATGHVRYLLDLRREERSWRGLLAFLDEHYPEDVFLPNPKAPDQGPRIIWMARQIARVRELHYVRGRNLYGEPVCNECSPLRPFPCPTIRALDGEVSP